MISEDQLYTGILLACGPVYNLFCIQFVFLEDDRKKPQINAHADTLISAAFSGISFSWMTGTIFSEAAAGV